MKSNRQGRWSGVMVMALLFTGGVVGGQSTAVPADPCEAPIPPEMGADYDDNCWAYTPNSSGAMFTEMWEKRVEVDCPALDWTTGEISPVISCAKVGSNKPETASRPGKPNLKAGNIHCLYEADGYDCGNHEEPCTINPDSLATSWIIETDHQVQPKSGIGEEAKFDVSMPEDETGPIEFEVAFKVKGEGCYPELLDANGCVMEAEAGKVPVTVHPVRLIINIQPEEPWAGEVVAYSLEAESLVPPDMAVQWAAINDFADCSGNERSLPSPGGGSFVTPYHRDSESPIIATVCAVVQKMVVTAHCKSCEDVLSSFLAAYNLQNDLVEQILEKQPQALSLQQQIKLIELKISMLLILEISSGCASANAPGKQDVPKTIAEFLGKAYEAVADQPEQADKLNQYAEELYELMTEYIELGFDALYNEYVDQTKITKEKSDDAEACMGSVPYAALCLSTIEQARSICEMPDIFMGSEFCEPVKINMPKAAELVKTTCFM
jgi:hypothetical protein